MPTPESERMVASLGVSPTVMGMLTVSSILGAVFILFPKPFVEGNLVNAAGAMVMAYYFWSSGNMQTVLIEIPFFLVPFLMIYLRHPFAK
ncbi:MAG: hypothetical protein HY961_06295 [Ignavibacteriae bacterium]|nr:hypothetical protein [Ignavibacteriota bacterium]